jgi:nucleoside-diphosphate-sugar epimerase
MKNILILGGGGFIGGNLAKKLKADGNFVRIADIKPHEYLSHSEICDEFIIGDLRNAIFVEQIMTCPNKCFDEVYQLAADMGGALYIFTGEHDADVMHNSALINLNVAKEAVKQKVGRIFYYIPSARPLQTHFFSAAQQIPQGVNDGLGLPSVRSPPKGNRA